MREEKAKALQSARSKKKNNGKMVDVVKEEQRLKSDSKRPTRPVIIKTNGAAPVASTSFPNAPGNAKFWKFTLGHEIQKLYSSQKLISIILDSERNKMTISQLMIKLNIISVPYCEMLKLLMHPGNAGKVSICALKDDRLGVARRTGEGRDADEKKNSLIQWCFSKLLVGIIFNFTFLNSTVSTFYINRRNFRFHISRPSQYENLRKMNADAINNENRTGFQLQVGDLLAKGSFSSTFLATTSPELSGNFSEVAKVGLKKHHQKYAKEQEILHVVNGHKYFPRIVYARESPKFTFIVTELAGEDLKAVSARNRFGLISNKNVIRLAHRLHGAVGYLHTKNFLHRDVKAENVLIELRNMRIRVKLSDFGDASNIGEPARRRSSFLNYFLPAALPPFCEAQDHCHVAVLCVKLLKDLSCIPRRKSVFWASNITQFEFPKLEEEHQWIELIWMSLCGCYENKETDFSFIATFLDAAVKGFDKRSDLDYDTFTGKLRLKAPNPDDC